MHQMVDLDRHEVQMEAAPVTDTPNSIEQVIEDIGARYVSDLRMLTEEISRFYQVELSAKDQQIAEKEEQIVQVQAQLKRVEQEHAALTERLREQEQFNARYVSELRAWTEELNRRIAIADSLASRVETAATGATL
jgi:predicted nuclease with TOPRIM domain